MPGLSRECSFSVLTTAASSGISAEESTTVRPSSARAHGPAENRTNASIAKELRLTEKTVETHVRSTLGVPDLPQDGDTDRRVRAVVTYLRASAA